MTKPLTEEVAAVAYATAWNLLNPEPFLELLSSNAGYASQWVFEEMKGAEAISNYLRGKMNTVRASGAGDMSFRVQVEIGRTTRGTYDRPCALMTQGSPEAKAVVLFEVKDGQIQRFDMCIPAFYAPVHTRVFPT